MPTIHEHGFTSAEGLLYTPFVNDGEVGYIILDTATEKIEVVSLTPSTNSDFNPSLPAKGDVFLRHGDYSQGQPDAVTYVLVHEQPLPEEQVTPRGFSMYAEFRYSPYRGEPEEIVTVQESSLATERRVWVGTTDRMHLTEKDAAIVRDALHRFIRAGKIDPTTEPV